VAVVPVVFCVGGNNETSRNIRSPRNEPRTSPTPGRIVELDSNVWCLVTCVGLLVVWAQQHGLSHNKNDVLCGVVQLLYKGALYPQNVIWFCGTLVNA
jgi:hypothetical protein